MSKYLLLLPLVILLSGCSCTRYTYGYVVDYETKEPLYFSEVYSYAALDDKIRDERVTTTDSSGWFETAFALNSIAKCGNLKLVISKKGYQTIYEVDLTPGDTVFLRKEQQ